MELLLEIVGGMFQLLAEFCGWFFLTFLQGIFACLLPTEDPRLMRLQWIGGALLFVGVVSTVASPFVGIAFGLAWGGGMFGIGIFAILVAGAIGGHIEEAVREDRQLESCKPRRGGSV